MVATLDLLTHPHSSIPYVQMGLIIVLYNNNLFYNDKVEFLPISQLISFAFKSVCFLFLAICSFQFSSQSKTKIFKTQICPALFQITRNRLVVFPCYPVILLLID